MKQNGTGFRVFFEAGPAAVLQAEDLRGPAFGKIEGHGVVITGESQNAWFIKNSWGDEFADDGYFRVAKGAIDSIRSDQRGIRWKLPGLGN